MSASLIGALIVVLAPYSMAQTHSTEVCTFDADATLQLDVNGADELRDPALITVFGSGEYVARKSFDSTDILSGTQSADAAMDLLQQAQTAILNAQFLADPAPAFGQFADTRTSHFLLIAGDCRQEFSIDGLSFKARDQASLVDLRRIEITLLELLARVQNPVAPAQN
ncbi:hypothetical protein [Aestuariibius sp. HNIBRBA575]|uniref:hypothetical protein n=1 Tax=Aestuariibius sp. HNIBRBA575 TaxID=3233343 RepID=UPI0034A2ADD8